MPCLINRRKLQVPEPEVKNPFIFPGPGDQTQRATQRQWHSMSLVCVKFRIHSLPNTKQNSRVLMTSSQQWCPLSIFLYFFTCVYHSLPWSIGKLRFYSDKLSFG